jgi:hypothetical protein
MWTSNIKYRGLKGIVETENADLLHRVIENDNKLSTQFTGLNQFRAQYIDFILLYS